MLAFMLAQLVFSSRIHRSTRRINKRQSRRKKGPQILGLKRRCRYMKKVTFRQNTQNVTAQLAFFFHIEFLH